MITNFQSLHEMVQGQAPKRVALVAAEDPVLLNAVARAQKEGFATFILVGSAKKIGSLIHGLDQQFEVVDASDPSTRAVELIHSGQADVLMKGKVSTANLLKAVLHREKGLRQGDLVNHIAVIESPHYHKLLFVSDGGINLHLDPYVFEQMVRNNAHYLRKLGITSPKFGMMSIIETVSPKIPETLVAQQVATALSGEFEIEGPIAPDVALSRNAAKIKGIDSKISGEVDVFLMSNTTTANHFIKGLVFLGGCKVGGVIVGAKVPVILLSRSDDAETRYRSILLGLV